jgi:two-component system response regulator VicR
MRNETNIKAGSTLTTGQAAKICQVDPRTVIRWIDEGVLSAYELPVTGFKRIRSEDFVAFLKAHTIPVPEEYLSLLKPRILVVDDEAGVRHAIRRILQYPDESQYELEFAVDGFDAGRKITAFRPDLVILDIMMPQLDGFSVLRAIREDVKTRRTKVMVMSSLLRDSERKQATDHGADDFLSKPFDDEVFKQRVGHLLGRRAVR